MEPPADLRNFQDVLLKFWRLYHTMRDLEAEEFALRALRVYPENPELLFCLGLVLYRADRRGFFSKIPEERSSTYVEYFGRVIAACSEGPLFHFARIDLQSATEGEERVLEMSAVLAPLPVAPFFYVERAIVALHTGSDEQRRQIPQDMKNCLDVFDFCLDAAALYALFFVDSHPAQALSAIDYAIARNSEDGEFHMIRGHALRNLGRSRESYEAFRRAMTLCPKVDTAYIETFRAAGDFPGERLRCFEGAIAAAPEDAVPIIQELWGRNRKHPKRRIALRRQIALGLATLADPAFESRRDPPDADYRKLSLDLIVFTISDAEAQYEAGKLRLETVEVCRRDLEGYVVDYFRKAKAARTLHLALTDARYRPGGAGYAAARASFFELAARR